MRFASLGSKCRRSGWNVKHCRFSKNQPSVHLELEDLGNWRIVNCSYPKQFDWEIKGGKMSTTKKSAKKSRNFFSSSKTKNIVLRLKHSQRRASNSISKCSHASMWYFLLFFRPIRKRWLSAGWTLKDFLTGPSKGPVRKSLRNLYKNVEKNTLF